MQSKINEDVLMTISEEDIDNFFKLAVAAIKDENEFWNTKLRDYGVVGYYTWRHHGIWFLVEQAIVYVILRRLVDEQFRLEVLWEQPYPGNKRLHVDIALKGEKPVFIEFKASRFRKGYSDVKNDVEKLRNTKQVRGFIFCIWLDAEELDRMQIDYKLELRHLETLDTFILEGKRLVQKTLTLAMFEVK